MRAAVVKAAGDPSVISVEEWPEPTPGPGEVLVRTTHAGVNFADVLMRQGESGSSFPLVLGVEGAGVVAELGAGVSELSVGDRVAWAPVKRASSVGSYAELAVVGAEQALPIPDDVLLEVAAAVTLQGLTAHYLANEHHPVGDGTRVLVHAGAGGTGRLATQWLKHLGAEVFATVGSDDKAAVALQAGADHVINYTTHDFVDAVHELTDGEGVDYVVDGVGGGTFKGDLRVVADRGRICVFGRAAGLPETFSPMELVFRSITVSGGYMTNFLRDREEVLRKADDVWQGVREGWLTPLMHAVLPLEAASEAHRQLETRSSVGKALLEIGAHP